jgi:hypothetical protein
MSFKKMLALCLAAILVFTAAPITQASAAVTPLWINTSTVSTAILFSGTDATCQVSINALSGSTIEADIYLYKQNANGTYSLEESWLDETSASIFFFSEPYTVISGKTYKLSVTAVVTRNGTSETVSSSVTRTVS